MHAHIGDLRSPESLERAPITPEDLIARLDDAGIDRAVVLPWPPCPEAVTFPALFGPAPDIVGQIRNAAGYPDRLSRPGRWRREPFRRQSATGRGCATLFGSADPGSDGNWNAGRLANAFSRSPFSPAFSCSYLYVSSLD